MKKITLLIAMLLITTTASAFWSGPGKAPTTGKLVPPTHEYELDTWGSNSEVYEFTPRSNTNITCVVFMNDAFTSITMQCFPRPIIKKQGK